MQQEGSAVSQPRFSNVTQKREGCPRRMLSQTQSVSTTSGRRMHRLGYDALAALAGLSFDRLVSLGPQ